MAFQLPPAASARLAGLTELVLGAPVWALHGPGVDDCVVGADHVRRDFEQVLLQVLHANGYERVVFSTSSRPIYFRDPVSHRLARPATSRFRGPLGNAFVLPEPARTEAPDPARRVDSISDPSRIQTLNALMCQREPRTAVVLVHADTLLEYLDGQRAFAGALDRWIAGDAHRNTCVLLFPQDQLDTVVQRLEERHAFPRLVSHLRDRTARNRCHIPAPEEAELARLVQVNRLRQGLELLWTDLPNVVRTMAAQRRSARDWDRDLEVLARDFVPLTLPVLRERGLVTGALPDGRTARQRLDELVGLEPVREFVRARISAAAADAELRARGLGRDHDVSSPHLVFTGNPGTGKTTVAELVGELYRDLGILRLGHVVAPAVDELVGEYVGQTAARTRARITEALDGVLFIDEAYRLSDQRGGFGQEAIDTLLSEMEQRRGRLVVIVAGYPDKITEFLRSNPGLGGRFPERNRIEFPDFEPPQLRDILLGRLREHYGLECAPELTEVLGQLVTGLHRTRDEHFANARTMREVAAEIRDRWAVRTAPAPGRPLEPVTPEDVPVRYRVLLDRGEVRLADVLAEMDDLVGLAPVKQSMRELVDTLALRKRRGLAPPVAPHMVFRGPPGTGKTTVARLVGGMLRSIGLLAKGHVVETSRADLVAGYVGQTAEKTRAKVREALDGVLFIDEAYALVDGGPTDFGAEAITELVAQMENLRGRLVVVAAGYPDDMDDLLAANDGLRSRFTRHVDFPGYTVPELRQILERQAAAMNFRFAEGTLPRAVRLLENCRTRDGRSFGNGRTVRNLLEKMEARMGGRLHGQLDSAPDSVLSEFLAVDVPSELP